MSVVVTRRLNRAQLDFVLRSPDGRVAAELARIAQDIVNAAKILAPVDTGRLRASIGWTIGTTSSGLFAEVGTNVEYAPFVEFGTGRASAQPYLIPAILQVLGRA